MAARAECEGKRVAVEMRGIVKRFPGVVANDGVDFAACEGEVHGLLGENGAGKTTLVSILYGLLKPDAGEIFLWGEKVEKWSPKKALEKGLAMVSQHFKLIPKLTVLENVALAFAGAGRRASLAQLRKELEKLSEEYGLRVKLDDYVWQLSAGEKQRVELLRALALGARLVILDEPTSVLTPIEARALFKVLRKMAEEGRTVIFITHKLWEALEVCDRITVMRRGKNVGTVKREEATWQLLTQLMFGQAVELGGRGKALPEEKLVLEVEGLWVKSDRGHWAVKGASFSVRRGEVFAVVGVAGNGQRELVEALVGLRKKERGRVFVDGVDATKLPTRKIIELGVAYVPESRLEQGVARGLSVAENLVLKSYWREPCSRGPIVRWSAVEKLAEELVAKYGIVAPSVRSPVEALSGGNVQRLVLARELSSRTKLLIAHNPTSGLDARSAALFHEEIASLASEGCAVLLVTEELEEALELGDRVAVMYGGKLVGPFDAKAVTLDFVGYVMTTGELPEGAKAAGGAEQRSLAAARAP